MEEMKPGVWVSGDMEMVRTGRYEIIYRRTRDGSGDLEAFCSIIGSSNDAFAKKTRGYVRFSNSETPVFVVQQELTSDRYIRDDRSANAGMRDGVPSAPCVNGTSGGKLLVYDSNDKSEHALDQIESFSAISERIPQPRVFESTIGNCLRTWTLGTAIQESAAQDGLCGWAITINTCHHMYIFHSGNSGTYCRAARYATCDKGEVFAQNFRISEFPELRQGYMAADNRIASHRLEIDMERFAIGQCFIPSGSEGGAMAGIYWSVKSSSDEEIILNGCGGEDYCIQLPTEKAEWFRSKPSI